MGYIQRASLGVEEWKIRWQRKLKMNRQLECRENAYLEAGGSSGVTRSCWIVQWNMTGRLRTSRAFMMKCHKGIVYKKYILCLVVYNKQISVSLCP